jgi:hypothetical protein
MESLSEVMRLTRWEYEIILVDDCSGDGTRAIIEDICSSTPHCSFIFHDVNSGRGAAFKTGFRQARGTVVGFIDIDLEVGAHYVPTLVQQILSHGYDVATGHRHYLIRQTGGVLRVLLSYSYRRLGRLVLRFGIRDSETGYKFFNRDRAAGVVLGSEHDGWFWDTEVMCRSVLADLKIIEIPVLYLRRFDKQTTVRVLPDAIRCFRQLLKFQRQMGLSAMARSPVYWSPALYDVTMWLLHGRELGVATDRVAGYIEPDSKVVDVCAGTAHLAASVVARGCTYLALDFNSTFVLSVRKRGIRARFHNVHTDAIPAADYVVMISSFYHFRDCEDEVFERLRSAARRAVVLCEPVRNLSNHRIVPLAKLANRLTNPGGDDYRFRHSIETFRAFCDRHDADVFEHDGSFAYAVFSLDKHDSE